MPTWLSSWQMGESATQSIQSLWDEMSEFGASNIEAALEHMLVVLAELIGAQHTFWMGTVRMPSARPGDLFEGWRIRGVRRLPVSPEWEEAYKELVRRIDGGVGLDPSLALLVQRAGHYRVTINSEIMDGSWFESDYYNTHLKPLGIRDKIYVTTPIGSDVESWLIFEREGEKQPPFSDAERALIDEAIRPLRWFHRQLLLHYGLLLADTPLTAAERNLLSELLTDKTEAGIAEVLNLATSTVHTYCTRICRKFNVRGRAGLIALWLGKIPGGQEG